MARAHRGATTSRLRSVPLSRDYDGAAVRYEVAITGDANNVTIDEFSAPEMEGA